MQTEFVTMDLENNPAWNAELEGFKPIITDYGNKGFRFCGYVPEKFGPTGKTLVISLVFQKDQ